MLTSQENSLKLSNIMDDLGDLNQSKQNPAAHKNENLVEKILKTDNKPDNKKNLYQNIGTRVSKLREINENYQVKIKSQEEELKLLDERIKAKMNLLQTEMRDQKKLQDPNWVNEKYNEMVNKNQIKLRININHVNNDPALKKIYNEKQAEVSSLQNKLNNLTKKTEHMKSEINVLRIENHKHKTNLEQIITKKDGQSKEMDKISEEANRFLKEKGTINKELVELNEKIDNQKVSYENKMGELNKMIDNTKKIKEFHETLALERFSKTTFRNSENGNKPTNKISEEQNKLADLNKELKRKKEQTVYLNFCRIILLKKQQELNNIIEKVKTETGVENLDKLSKYLELSTKTNKLFETDLKSLNEQKKTLQKQIEDIKEETQKAECILNDTSTKKFEYLDKLKVDLEKEESIKEKLNKKLYTLNRVIELMSKGFKEICTKLNFFDTNLKFDEGVIIVYNV